MLPALSYSQSRSEKYPKQTVVNGDTVVILRLEQAVMMNESFIEFNRVQDSLISTIDSADIRFDLLKVNLLKLEQYKYDVSNATAENKKHWVRDNWLRVGFFAGFIASFAAIVNSQ